VLLLFQERRKQEREEEDKRMAEQRAADDARRKAEEVSKLHTPKKHVSNEIQNYKSLQLWRHIFQNQQVTIRYVANV